MLNCLQPYVCRLLEAGLSKDEARLMEIAKSEDTTPDELVMLSKNRYAPDRIKEIAAKRSMDHHFEGWDRFDQTHFLFI